MMAGIARFVVLAISAVFCGALPICAQPPAQQTSAVDSLGDPLPSGARLRLGTLRFRPPSSVGELALSPDEKTIVTAGAELIAWDAANGKELWRAPSKDFGQAIPVAAYGVRALAFAPDGARFYTARKLDEVVVWSTQHGTHEVLAIKTAKKAPSLHSLNARSIDVSPDGKKLARGSASGLIVCDLGGNVRYEIANAPVAQPEVVRNDRLSFGGPFSLCRFSPDGRLLAVVTSDHPQSVKLCDAESGRLVREVALASRLVRLAFSPDSKQLATTERDNAVRLYDTATGKRLWSHIVKLTNIYENYTSALAFSPDGKTLAVCATDNRIYLIDAATGDETAALTGHHWYPWALAFTRNGKILFSSGWDGFIRRWDVAERKQLALPAGVRATGVVAASPDGRTLAYAIDSGAVRLVDAESGKDGHQLTIGGAQYSQLKFSPDGHTLAAGGTCDNQVHVALWDVPTGKLAHRWDWPLGPDPHSDIESLCFALDGSRLAAAVFRQSAAYVWDLKTLKQTSKINHAQIYGLDFSPDSRTLVTVGWDSVIRFWEAATGAAAGEIAVTKHASNGDLRMYAVCWEPEGTFATAHLDGMVRIWQANARKMRNGFRVPGRFIHGALDFSPDGLWLATGSMDGSVSIWEPETGTIVRDAGRHQSQVYTLAFLGGARSLASGGSDGLCYVWDMQPPDVQVKSDIGRLWKDLTGDLDGKAAFDATLALSKVPDRAVPMLAENLRQVQTIVDLDAIAEGSADQEAQRRRRLTRLLVERDPKVKLAIGVRRAVSLLEQIGTPAAIASLKELATLGATKEIPRLAAAALERSRAAQTLRGRDG